ncbi:MAG: hypothetical protein OEL81_01310 [Nitrosopumilus sp.]|nr:hypothetical protein [Nitrosopumilus sp.]
MTNKNNSLKFRTFAMYILFAFIFILVLNTQNIYAENSESKSHEVTIFTDKKVYQPRDEIAITFANTGNVSVSFHASSGGMTIKSLDNNIVLAGGGGYQASWWMEPNQNNTITFGPFKGISNGIYVINMTYAVPEGENESLVAYHPTNQFEIACKKGLDLIFKITDDSPACVRSNSISKLIERGWAKP